MRWRGSRSSSISLSESSASAADGGGRPRRRLSIPLAALGPVGRRRRLAIAALAAGLFLGREGETVSRAAALAPPDTTVFVRSDGSEDAARLWEIAERFPSLAALRESLLGPDLDPGRDIRPWLGGELALVVPGPLLLAAVGDLPGAERFQERLPEDVASAFVGDFLVIGPEAAVTTARDRADGDDPSLADG